jgi:probable F420-dependent oxidoreductase
MKLGVQVPHFGPNASPEGVLEVARRAEEMELDAVWVSDHVVFPTAANSSYPHSSKGLPTANLSPIFEALTTLSFLAGATSSVRLGTSILLPALRQPVLAAKMLASLDVLCGGRLVLGVGAGWLEAEFELLGVSDFDRRGRLLDETINVWRTLWADRSPSFEGDFFRFEEMIFDPLPAQRPGPPIWVGGHSPPALRRAARIGDGWHAARVGPAEFAELVGRLREELAAVDRPADAVVPSLTCVFRPADEEIDVGRLRDLVGPPALIAEQIGRYGEAGCEEIVLGLDPRGTRDDHRRALDALAAEILPAVR